MNARRMLAVLVAPLFLSPVSAAETAADRSVAAGLIEKAGISRGLCSIVGAGDGTIPIEIVRQSSFLVHVWGSGDTAALRGQADEEGLHGKRIVAEAGSLARLPYADNLVDCVFAASLGDKDLEALAPSEVLRVLRPLGRAILGARAGAGALTRARLEDWGRGISGGEVSVIEDGTGLWARLTKQRPAGLDEWSHWEHGPDNNPVSSDAVIKAPYRTQWLGLPYYITMPAITTASGGRVFLATGHIAHHRREEMWLNTLIARNGYNGEILWTKKLPDGYLAHRSAFIAGPEAFVMIDPDGSGCLLLDPETGASKGRIDGAGGDWKWIAMSDDLLFVLAGKQKDPPETTVVRSPRTHWSWGELSKGYYERQVPWGFGHTILALRAGKAIWTHEEEKPADSRAMAVGGGRLFFYSPGGRIGCLDGSSGKLIWANDDPKVRELIDQPGRGLTSTPGFRTTCYALYTPRALYYEAQTHMNVVAVSLDDGRLLWHRKKTTSNPNLMYLDDQLLVGIGPGGSTLALDPLTGETRQDLGFAKRSCARLTATPDSLFCRGMPEGLTRYDRIEKKVLFNGAFRPSCNDGVIAANGLLYAGPWTCDCNLSLMGAIALCSAGGFDPDRPAEGARLEMGERDPLQVAPLDAGAEDWSMYRGSPSRGASSRASIGVNIKRLWGFQPKVPFEPTAPVAAGGLVFLGGDDCKVRAFDAATGGPRWTFMTAGRVLQPPTIWNGRAYFGSGDGHVYAVEATTGRLLWRFRVAPAERRIMAYGALSSTWPVDTGVLVKDGIAYAAAGIIDYDGTYVVALDAVTGKLQWENASTGHLDEELRKGVSAQGVLVPASGRLWMPGGNVISPAAYDLKTGAYLSGGPGNGSPRANRGEEIGVIKDRYLVLGGRLKFSARQNVVDPGEFFVHEIGPDGSLGKSVLMNRGKIPSAWDDSRVVMVEGPASVPRCLSLEGMEKGFGEGERRPKLEPLWRAGWEDQSDAVSLAIARNAVLAVCEIPVPGSLASRWIVRCLSRDDGRVLWEEKLPSAAAAGGLLVDRDGRVIVVLENGGLISIAGERSA